MESVCWFSSRPLGALKSPAQLADNAILERGHEGLVQGSGEGGGGGIKALAFEVVTITGP